LLGIFGSGPKKFIAGDRRQELEPALLRVERDNAAGPLAVGQVEVLRVAPERVGVVVSPRDGERLAGADDGELVGEVPRRGGSGTPAAEVLSGDRRLALGHALTLAGDAAHLASIRTCVRV